VSTYDRPSRSSSFGQMMHPVFARHPHCGGRHCPAQRLIDPHGCHCRSSLPWNLHQAASISVVLLHATQYSSVLGTNLVESSTQMRRSLPHLLLPRRLARTAEYTLRASPRSLRLQLRRVIKCHMLNERAYLTANESISYSSICSATADPKSVVRLIRELENGTIRGLYPGYLTFITARA